MFHRLKKLYKLLTDNQRKKLMHLQILVVLMAFAEVAGIVAIAPFMALVGDMGKLQGEGTLAQLYQATGFADPQQFLFWLGIAVLIALTIASGVSMYTTWRLSLYASKIGAEVSTRLYKYYMFQPWLFHTSGSSSRLTNRIAQESGRITNQVIHPLMLMNAKAMMALVMIIALLILNPAVAVVGLMVFGSAYFLLFKTVRERLSRNGNIITKANQERFKLMNEGFGGIKDTLLLGRQAIFNQRFEKASQQFGHSQGVTRALSQAPRYLMQLIAFGAVIFLVLYLLAAYEGDLGQILPLLSIYALAGFKLLPAFQQIYSSLAQVKGNIASFDSLEKDLNSSVKFINEFTGMLSDKLTPKELIELDGIHLTYPGKSSKALNGISLKIPVRQTIGLVGPSGSGKSSAVDVLLGLIEPEAGVLKIDGQEIKGDRLRAWQNNIGYVPQAIFLVDGSIRENIAFGLTPEEVDEAGVLKAATLAQLDELLEGLPDGVNTRVGERGVQLSGGQRQRIGIARALYEDPEVLILDEATSALDGITEKNVMDAVYEFLDNKTIIIIAHRLATVKRCNKVYLLADGGILDSGNYSELVLRNDLFKRMANHA